MDKYIKSESLRSVLYFILMIGVILGVQSINELFLPWSMLAIYIFIFLVLFKIIGASKNMFFPTIVITSFIFLIVMMFTLPRSERGIESYIEHKYELQQYKIIKCDYPLSLFLRSDGVPKRCVVSGYPAAEKEANLILNFIKFLAYFPLALGATFIVVKYSRDLKK